jgi:hypothetical protein
LNGDDVLCAKAKDRKTMLIGPGSEFHVRSTTVHATMRAHAHAKRFVLQIGEHETMEITFTRQDEGRGPRMAAVRFLAEMPGVPTELATRQAKRTASGVWTVDLAGRPAMTSVKNCGLVDADGREVIVVRKTEKDVIVVEALERVPAACAFAFGLAQYLCHI